MAGLSDIGTGAAANVLTSLLKKVVQEVKMVISLPQSFRDMEGEVGRLNNMRNDINVELARVQMNPKSVVKGWLDKADEAIKSSETIGRDYQQRKNCLSCCPNCLSRYTISKRIRDWKGDVAQLHLQRQSDFPPSGEYGDYIPPAQIPIEIAESGFVGNAIQSMQSKVEEWLTEDSNIRIIGIFGMGGVGKTSLLQTINNSLMVRNSFDVIIWVTVSKDYDILNLQDCIADRLELRNFPDKSNLEERKYKLCSYLKNKKFLLLLDDLWESFELQSLGVSLNDRGSKIVLSTRSKVVCTEMRVDEKIGVEPLLEDDGWGLFCSRAFRNGNVPQGIEEIARKIARECKGLPLAILVVSAAMAHYTCPHEWELALHQMQNVDSTFYDIHSRINRELFQRLEWSYNDLPEYLKTSFLHFAAYPEDAVIYCEEVIDIWIAEGVVKGTVESYLPDTAQSFISFLRDRCLIEVVSYDVVGRIEKVKIHDVLRDLAIHIAEKVHSCYFKAGNGRSYFPLEEVDSEQCAKMSLISNNLQSLPPTFACPPLLVLLLSHNRGIKEVPGSFLNELPSLRVLDLSQTGITCLPPCIGNLKHLASLQLVGTDICELPASICDLKELQFLNLRDCRKLRCLPERISELKRLRALDISFCRTLSHLPRGISELVSLERLSMGNSSISLHFEGDANAERMYACFKDLQSLRRLRFLWVKMKSAVKEGVMGNWSKMRDLSLSFDDDVNQDELPQDMQAMKDLERFALASCDVERLPSCLTQFRKLADLYIWECKQLKELPAELPCLRELDISYCDKLEELELELGMGFPKLETVILYGLKSLECVGVGEGAAASGSGSGSGGFGEGASPLPMLKTLDVRKCPKLKRLRGGWDKLKCLESIEGDSRELWDSIQCDDPSIKTSLQSRFKAWR